jgi:hypothetical protein
MVGKTKRTISLTGKRSVNAEGHRSNFKKAYVTLADGQALPFFDAIEEEEQQEQATQEKIDKAAAKQAAKDEKAAAKAKPSKSTATPKKPTAKAAPTSDQKVLPTIPEEEKKPHLPAWRGFRLGKKRKDGDK